MLLNEAVMGTDRCRSTHTYSILTLEARREENIFYDALDVRR